MPADPPARSIPDPGFAGDTGEPDPRLTAALEAVTADPARLPELLAALHQVRVVAPVVAQVGETAMSSTGRLQEKSADIAVPLLLDGTGSRALLVFSGTPALARWDPAARPVPVLGARAAEVALAEGAEAIVLDVAGPDPVTLPLLEVRALAEGRGRVPAWTDPALQRAVATVLGGEPAARSAHLDPCAGADARLTIVVDPGVDPTAIGARLVAALTAVAEVAGGVRGLEITVVHA
ncbi:MAG TPA: SseB family protein [Actinomycetes bacterium]|nr:SseB family protein [Actinomycetes bacterium]